MTKLTPAPHHLSAESRKLWRATLADYEPEPRYQTVLLTARREEVTRRVAPRAVRPRR